MTTHSAPLRAQGTWAEQHVAAAGHVAVLPPGVPFDAAAALPVPALTADQVIGDALAVRGGQTVLVNGAGGVTGGMLVQLAVYRRATVIATADADSAAPMASRTERLPLPHRDALRIAFGRRRAVAGPGLGAGPGVHGSGAEPTGT